jgi:hypothetical protein
MPAGEVNLPIKAVPMRRMLISVYLHILEHELIVTEP